MSKGKSKTTTWLDVNDDGRLYDVDVPEIPELPKMSWLEYLKDYTCCRWSSLSDEDKEYELSQYGLEPDADLSENISEEVALGLIDDTYTPTGTAYLHLRELENDKDAEGVIEYGQEGYFDGEGFFFELAGCRGALRKLLREKGLFPAINIQLVLEKLLPTIKTQALKTEVQKLIENDDDDVETVEEWLAMENWIANGEPETEVRSFMGITRDVKVDYPTDTPLYEVMKKELA